MPNLLAEGRLARWTAMAGGALAMSTIMAGNVLAAAAETPAAHGGEEHAGGLPQLNPATFPTQIFWLAVSFFALYYLMSRKALPRVAAVLEARQDRITADLNTATALKDEAETVMAAVDATLADARAKAQAMIAETVAAIEETTRARQGEVGASIAARLSDAEAQIKAAKEQAIANVRASAGEIAGEIARKLGGVDADPAGIEAAVNAAIEERRQ